MNVQNLWRRELDKEGVDGRVPLQHCGLVGGCEGELGGQSRAHCRLTFFRNLYSVLSEAWLAGVRC